jgi:nitric oxide dioxygenase
MDLRQIELVRASYAEVDGRGEVIDRFFAGLFAADPEALPLFTDVAATRDKFADELAVIVASLTDLDSLQARARALGASHRSYGVTPRQFDAAREALVAALAEELGSEFTDETAEAWRRAYNLVAEMMMES